MSKNDGGQAFPVQMIINGNGDWVYGPNGMTLRQYYAGQFAAATIANPDYLEVVTQSHGGQPEKMVARVAVQYADALIAELEK